MTITYSPMNLLCELNEYTVLTLVIENQRVFHNLISDIYGQIRGENGEFVISENYRILETRKKAELITQFVPFEMNRKELINRLYSELKLNSVNEKNYQLTQQLLADLSKYIFNIAEDIDNELIYDMPSDISGILKSFNIRFSDENMTLSEKILEYMTAVNKYTGDKIFFLVNLKSYLTDNEAELLFKSIVLKKLSAVCIENCDRKRIPYEKTVIIDKDMCVI